MTEETIPALGGPDSYNTAEGIANRIGSYHQFCRLIVEPRLAAGRASTEALRSFVVGGRFYLSGDGSTYVLLRQEDPEFFAALPAVCDGESFLKACLAHGLVRPLWSPDVTLPQNATVRPTDAICTLCEEGWSDAFWEASDYVTGPDEDGTTRFCHGHCHEALLVCRLQECNEELQELATEMLAGIGFGPNVGTEVHDATLTPELRADLARIFRVTGPARRHDALLQEWVKPRMVHVSSDIGSFHILFDGKENILCLGGLDLDIDALFGGIFDFNNREEGVPRHFLSVDDDYALTALSVLYSHLLQRDRERLQRQLASATEELVQLRGTARP